MKHSQKKIPQKTTVKKENEFSFAPDRLTITDSNGDPTTDNYQWTFKTLWWFIENKEKIFIDRELMQRVFAVWKPSRVDSYLLSLLNGTGLLSIRLLVNINSIINDITERISEFSSTDPEYENLKFTLDHMKELKEDGKEYILLDGQHRIKTEKSWLAPEPDEVAYKPRKIATYLNNKIFAKNGGGVKLTEKEFNELHPDVQKLIREITVPVVIINSATVDQQMSIYKAVNSGTSLARMDLRLSTLSLVANFLRECSNIEKNPFIVKYFQRAFKPDFLKKREDLRTILLSVLFAYQEEYKVMDEKALDSACDYGAPIRKGRLDKVEKVWQILTEGFLTHYKSNDTFAVVDLGGIKNLSLLMHVFTYQLLNRKLPIFKTEFKDVSITIGRKGNYVDLLEKMIIKLDYLDRYYYYDDNGQITVVEHFDKDGKPKYVTIVDPITKKVSNVENEHGFCRQKGGRTIGKNLPSQLQKLNNLFYGVVKDWIKAGVLIEVSKNRGRISKAQKLHKASKANWIEPESGNILMTHDVTDGNKTHVVHVGDKSYSEGGTETEVGNAQINLKIGTKKVNIGV